MMVTVGEFGKDHWFLLSYIESRCVDGGHRSWNGGIGTIDPRHMRQDGAKYPTRLCGGRLLSDHNDYDCLRDLEDAGLLVAGSAGMSARMTERGMEIAGLVRAHKARGGTWSSFSLALVPAAKSIPAE